MSVYFVVDDNYNFDIIDPDRPEAPCEPADEFPEEEPPTTRRTYSDLEMLLLRIV